MHTLDQDDTKNRREKIQGGILAKRIQTMKKSTFWKHDLMGYIYGFRLINITLTYLTYKIYSTKYISTKSLRNIYNIYLYQIFYYR